MVVFYLFCFVYLCFNIFLLPDVFWRNYLQRSLCFKPTLKRPNLNASVRSAAPLVPLCGPMLSGCLIFTPWSRRERTADVWGKNLLCKFLLTIFVFLWAWKIQFIPNWVVARISLMLYEGHCLALLLQVTDPTWRVRFTTGPCLTSGGCSLEERKLTLCNNSCFFCLTIISVRTVTLNQLRYNNSLLLW